MDVNFNTEDTIDTPHIVIVAGDKYEYGYLEHGFGPLMARDFQLCHTLKGDFMFKLRPRK